MKGTVNRRHEAIVSVRVRVAGTAEMQLDAIIDTGFSGSLTLPPPLVASLELPRVSGGGGVLADGSVRQFEIHSGEMEWHGVWRPVLVSAVGAEPLIGMGLLVGSELRMEVTSGGPVVIEPIRPV